MIEPTADTAEVIRALHELCGESIPRADLPVTIPDPDDDDPTDDDTPDFED